MSKRIMALPQDPVPSWQVNVVIPDGMNFKMEEMEVVTKNIMKRLGCETCHSGYQIRWCAQRVFYKERRMDVIINAKTLAVGAIGR